MSDNSGEWESAHLVWENFPGKDRLEALMSTPYWEVNTWEKEQQHPSIHPPSCCTLFLKHIQPLPLVASDKSSRMTNNPLAQIQSNHGMKIHTWARTRTGQWRSKPHDI